MPNGEDAAAHADKVVSKPHVGVRLSCTCIVYRGVCSVEMVLSSMNTVFRMMNQ